jgi:signal peptidase I
MLLSKFKILGHSMEPTLRNGQVVLISKLPYFFKKPHVNDIVAFENEKEVLIKRIAKINSKEIFVKGDNLSDSIDSRKLGFINVNKIIGKVIYKI